MRTKTDSATTKYLTSYSEFSAQQFDDFPYRFQHGLVIPVYREELLQMQRFIDFAIINKATLLIFVINRPDNDNDIRWAFPFLNAFTNVLWQCSAQQTTLVSLDIEHRDLQSKSAILLVDRCVLGQALPKNQGVGLARKIGADILCALIAEKKVRSPWIFNTDADTHLPINYFSAADKHYQKNAAALIYPYKHVFPDKQTPILPTLLYEFSLYYYVEGLRNAGSPYANHTIGSIIAVNYTHYAMVRGFPKRAAAEDFYLLNKLTKTGEIISLTEPELKIAARESTRVPFGTGPAVIDLAAQANPMNMSLYHPKCFDYLKVFLQLLDSLSEHDSVVDIKQAIHVVINNQPINTIKHEYLWNIAKHIDLSAALKHSVVHGKKKSTRLQQLHHWFDGFRTMKFIHYLRDNHLGTLSFQHMLAEPSWRNNAKLLALAQEIESLAKSIKIAPQ